ncbi:MAG: 50S ribosomal protein L35ae [Candidatus Woesearchaeota archaeon]
MKGTITNYRRGRTTQKTNHMIVLPEGVENKEQAEKLVGKSVSWKSPANKEIKGKVSAAHGSKGAIRVIFDTGMPGQSVATEVKIN